ncbi:MAG: M24 family metallopeptidase [Haloferacaceae archaeon]
MDATELDRRADRLDDYLDDAGLEAVWFGRPEAVAWATGGSVATDRAARVGDAVVGYDGSFTAVSTNAEADRLRAEELPERISVETVEWHAASLAEVIAERSPTPAAADVDVPGLERVDASQLRLPLTDGEVDRYRALGRDAAEAVERACRAVDPDDTERDLAFGVRTLLAERDVAAPTILVGGERRAQRYRSPTPTGERVEGYARVTVVAERDGLHAPLTRHVAFDPPDSLADDLTRAAQLEVSALGATRAVGRFGGDVGSVFDGVEATYEFLDDGDGWREGPVGGATGYLAAEWTARPDSDAPVQSPVACAFGPVVGGARSQDTVLVADEGFEVLTRTGEWPTSPVVSWDYDAAIPRHRVLLVE